MKFWCKILFIGILLLGSFIRVYRLGEIPSGFHADEAAFGYNAYSLLKTGKDEYGNAFPIILKSFGDYKGAFYSYITIPFVGLFGLNEWSVRVPTTIFGILMIALVYFFVEKITKRRDMAFVAMLLESISPISVLLSRVQSEPLVSVFFVFLGMYFFLEWSEKGKLRYIVGCSIAWIISILISTLPRLYLLMLIPILIIWLFPIFNRYQKKITFLVGFFVVFCIGIMLYSASTERFGQIGVFFKKDVILLMEEKIREDGVGESFFLETRIFHNKVAEYGRYFMLNYSQYFSYDFLIHQANQPKREMIPNSGVILLIELPFLLLGIFLVLKNKYRWGVFLVLMLFVTPALLSFASDETPNIHRFYLAGMPLFLLTSVGIVGLLQAIKGKSRNFIILVITALFIGNVWYFFHQLFIHQPTHTPYYRDYAYKPLIESIKKYYLQYDKIVFTKDLGSPYIHILFFWPFDPLLYQQMGSPRDMDDTGFDKYVFVTQACPSDEDKYEKQWPDKNIMYIDKSECKPSPLEILDIIHWQNGVPAFQIVGKNKKIL